MTENLPVYVLVDEYNINEYYKKGYLVHSMITVPYNYSSNDTRKVDFTGHFMGNQVNVSGHIPVPSPPSYNVKFLMQLEGTAKILFGEKREPQRQD